jgi:hypothetical protein
VGGDMNARLGLNGDTVTNAEGRQLSSLAAETGLSVINATSKCSGNFTWERVVKGVPQRSTIDYCLSSKLAIVKSMAILSTASLRAGSDHKPLLLKLQMLPRVIEHRLMKRHPRLQWILPDHRDMSWDEYRRVLAVELGQWRESNVDFAQNVAGAPIEQKLLDAAARGLANSISSAASKVFAKRSTPASRRSSRFVDQQTKRIMDERDEALHVLHLEPSERAASAYYSLCRAVRSGIRKRKRAARRACHDKLERLCGSGRQFWSFFQAMTGSSSAELPDSFRRLDGELSVGPRGRVDAMREYFQDLGSSPPPVCASGLPEPQLDPPSTALDERVQAMVVALDEPVMPAEVRVAFARLRSGTAAGPDGIPPELVARGGPELESAFTSLLSAAWHSELWPQAWTEGITTVVHKKGSTDQLDNYRGLSLLNTLAKAGEYFVKARLTPYVESLPALHDSQGGFRPDRRCADQHFILSEICKSRREAKLASFLAFIDVRKAYDCVWPEGLLAAVSRVNIRGRMHSILRILSSEISRRARAGEDLSEPFQIHRGVPQGAVLSPLLYALFIDSLLQELESSGHGIAVACLASPVAALAFADDLALLAPTAEDLNALLAIVNRHSQQWRYTINASKSAVAIVGTKAQQEAARQNRFMVGSDELGFDYDYAYLGVPLSALFGRPQSHLQQRIASARAKAALLSGAGGARYNGIPCPVSIQLFNALVRPGLEWGAEVVTLSASMLKSLNAVQCSFLRTCSGSDSFVPNDFLLAEFGTQSLSSRRDELALRFFRHLCTADPNRMLSKVFRWRCALVRRGEAKQSACRGFMSLLDRYKRNDVWLALPRARDDGLWHLWESSIHESAVSSDVAARKVAIEARPSLFRFSCIKPLERRTTPSYLARRGLGMWLKLKMRANSLPLLGTLARHCRRPLSPESSHCRLCGGGAVEDVPHFLLVCSAFSDDRRKFGDAVLRDPKLSEMAGAWSVRATWSSGSLTDRVNLLLSSHEQPCDDGADTDHEPRHTRDPRVRGRRLAAAIGTFTASGSGTGSASASGSALTRHLESLFLRFAVSIWRKRAALLGGVPSLDVHGSKLVLSHLLDDGRCRSFAVGIHF